MAPWGRCATVSADHKAEVPTMIPITTDDYKQAELIIMRRDAERHWRTHAKVFAFGAVTLALAGLITSHLVAAAVIVLVWLAALGFHHLTAIRWFQRSTTEFQGRVQFVAEQRRITETV
jgi:hypothetical protein